MHIYFTTNWDEHRATLAGEEAHHAMHVMRIAKGDKLLLTDGKGIRAEAVVEQCTKREVHCYIHALELVKSEANVALSVAIAPTKNVKRMEWFVEKAVEIGVNDIYFIHTDHSERQYIRLDRLRKIAVSAMKQSQQFVCPALHDIQPLETVVKAFSQTDTFCVVAHKEAQSKSISELPRTKQFGIFIGPEGDFSQEELAHIKQLEWDFVTLGNHRLRTETAGIVALTQIHFHYAAQNHL